MSDFDQTFADRVLQNDTVTAVRRLIIGGLMAASTPFGVGALAAVSVSMLALNSFVFRHDKIAQQKKLLGFYKEEIGELLHKSPKSVTLDDLKHVAAPREEGGLGNANIQCELDEIETRKKMRVGGSAISSAITTGILIFLYPIVASTGGVLMLFSLGLTGLGYTAIARTVKVAMQATFGNHDTENTVNQRLIRIGEEIKERPVTPVEIFGLFVDADPKLKQDVKDTYHMDYHNLPVIQKTNVVEAMEPKLRVIALTNAVNRGEVRASYIGFAAGSHSLDRLSETAKYAEMFTRPVDNIPDAPYEMAANNVNLSDHRARLIAEREMANATRSLN